MVAAGEASAGRARFAVSRGAGVAADADAIVAAAGIALGEGLRDRSRPMARRLQERSGVYETAAAVWAGARSEATKDVSTFSVLPDVALAQWRSKSAAQRGVSLSACSSAKNHTDKMLVVLDEPRR